MYSMTGHWGNACSVYVCVSVSVSACAWVGLFGAHVCDKCEAGLLASDQRKRKKRKRKIRERERQMMHLLHSSKANVDQPGTTSTYLKKNI